MKKLFTLGLIVSLFLLLAVSGNAALTVSDLTLGSSTQGRGENVSGTVTLTNTDNATTLTLVPATALTSTADAKYKVAFTGVPATLAPLATATVSVTVFVPLDHNAADSNGVVQAFEVGKLTAKDSTGNVTGQGSLKVQAENKLRIRKGTATVSGATTSSDSFRDGSRLDQIKPGDHVELELEIENQFPGSGDKEVDFDDVEVTMDLSADEDFDVDDDSDSFSLDADEKDTMTFSLDVEEDAADRSHVLLFVVTALDENGARHGAKLSATLEVERDSNDLAIRSLSVSPEKLTCEGSRTVQVRADVLNRGKSDERNAAFEVRAQTLGVFEKKTGFRLDEDDNELVQLSFNVPTDAKPGQHEVDFFTLYDTSKENNVKSFTLTVEECKKEVKLPEPVKSAEETKVVQVPPAVTTQPQGAAVRVRSATNFTESSTYLVLLGVAVGVVFVLILALLAVLLKRK
ncbi:hypothetical protein HYV79_05410 [Candidatus Woesearchaeota archaeon]|nr:hypothetical protein [Candidatus Woesearchaeota archaeon]